MKCIVFLIIALLAIASISKGAKKEDKSAPGAKFDKTRNETWCHDYLTSDDYGFDAATFRRCKITVGLIGEDGKAPPVKPVRY